MDIFLKHEGNVSTWQAVNLMFLKLFKEKLRLATNKKESSNVQPRKDLTTEALLMIVLLAVLLIFAVLGSMSSAFEYLYEQNTQSKKPRKITGYRSFTCNLYKKAKNKISNRDANIVQVDFKEPYFIGKDWLNKSRSFLHCFCFIKNWKKLFQTDHDKEQFECFYGIRVISNLSIMCYHIVLFGIYTRKSMDELKPFLQSPIAKILYNTYFGVDAFFVLSGFLNAYSFSKTYNETCGKISWWNFYLKRFLRLTPAYMIVLGIYTTLFSYTGSGPIWPEYRTNPICKENWWRYFLYINNFESCLKSCMMWCWHLAAEMQLFVLSPIFLVSLIRFQKFGFYLTSFTIFLSGFLNFLITIRCNLLYCSLVQLDFHTVDFEFLFNRIWHYVDILYCKPYTRISSYLIGVLLGYYFGGKNYKDIRNRWLILCYGWIAAGILMWISFFALINREASVMETALYNCVKHIFFSIGMSWIVFVCLTEQGSLINAFLSWKWFLPLSKLSYCAYLIHVLILQRDYQAAQDLEEISPLSLVLYGVRVYFWTFIFSIPLSLLSELPIINLFGLYMKKKIDERKD